MKIWNVSRGPFENDDGQVWNVCLVEDKEGKIIEDEIYYDNMIDAMRMRDYFLSKIEPIEIFEFEEPKLL